MCGRFTLTSNLDELQGRFGFLTDLSSYEPRYNIAPTQPVLTVTNDGQRRGELMRWGLVPFWAKDLKVGARMINKMVGTVEVVVKIPFSENQTPVIHWNRFFRRSVPKTQPVR